MDMPTTKRPGFFALATAVVWTLSMMLLATVTLYRYNLAPDNAYKWMAPHFLNTEKQFAQMFALWDGEWYLKTASDGYRFVPDQMSNVAFLPLYPFLIRVAAYPLQSYIGAALLINFFALFGAIYFFIKLAKTEKLDSKETSVALFMLLAYPTAIFYLAVYTEALFLFLITGTFYFLKEKKYWIAGAFGMFAALTRIPGVFLFFPFAYYLWRDRARATQYLASFLVPLGAVFYMAILKLTTGSALSFLQAQKLWGRSFFHFNSEHFFFRTPAEIINFSFDALFALLLLGGVYLVYKKLDLGYAVFCAVSLLIPLSTGTLMSVMRFGMVLFPLFLAFAKIKNPLIKNSWMVLSLVALTLYTLQFVNGYWAG